MTALLRVLRGLEMAPAALAAAALFALMAMTFVDVIARSALDAPLPATPELTRILMAVVVFAAMPAVSARGRHISVDLLDPFLSGRAARLRDFVINVGCGVMLWWPAERVMVLAERARSYGDVTEYLALPTHYVAWFIAGSVCVAAVALIGRGLMALFAPELLGDGDGGGSGSGGGSAGG